MKRRAQTSISKSQKATTDVDHPEPFGRAFAKPRVVGQTPICDASDSQIRKPPKIRVIQDSQRLTPAELKSRFACNLDQLLNIIGLNRKDAAAEIGISYSLIRRLVTAGVSRIDDLNRESLNSIADYLGLASLADLWRDDLRQWVMTPGDHSSFAKKFHARLLAEQKRRQSQIKAQSSEELALLNQTLDPEPISFPRLRPELEKKLAAILKSSKANQFQTLIEDYFEFASQQLSNDRRAVNE